MMTKSSVLLLAVEMSSVNDSR